MRLVVVVVLVGKPPGAALLGATFAVGGQQRRTSQPTATPADSFTFDQGELDFRP